MKPADRPAPTPRTALDDYDLASLALCAFEGVTQPRITRTKWKDGIDLEIATPGLRRFADAVVERELSAAKAVAERLREAAKFRPDPRTLWVVWFEDAAIRPEVFFGDGAEEAAKAFYKQKLASWSCHLLGRIPDAALAATRKESSNG